MNINSRKLRLLKLLSDENNYQPTKFFASILGVSNKTIYNDVKELSEITPIFNVEISTVPRRGIRLTGQPENIARLMNHLKERRELIIVNYSPAYRKLKIVETLLLKDIQETQESFSERFCISCATLQNDIKEINQTFKHYHVAISTIQNNYQVIGQETNIQKAFAQYFLNYLNTDYQNRIEYVDEGFKIFIMGIFLDSLVEATIEILDNVLGLNHLAIDNTYKISLLITVLVQMSRIHLNYHTNVSENIVFENLNHYESYLLAVEIALEYEKKTGLIFNENDIKSLSERLFAHRIEPSIPNKILQDNYQNTVDLIIEKMAQLINVDFSLDTHLNNSLMYHIPSMIFRLKNNYVVKNPLVNEIKQQYMLLYSLTWFVLSHLEEEYDFVLSEDEVSFVTIHFQIAIEKINHPKKILIVCEHGVATSELMLSKIRQIIPDKQDIIKTLTKQELLESDLENVDLIISTVHLPDNLGVDIINVSPFLKKEDLSAILQKYSDLTFDETIIKRSSVLEDAEFQQYFSEDFIFIDQVFKNKRECLNFIVKHYQDFNLVHSEFETSLIEREKAGNTALSNQVAIPHANPKTIKSTKILVITLQQPIRWNEYFDIDFIVVLAISEKQLSKVRNLVAHLLEIVDDPATVNMLRKSQSSFELYQMLQTLI